jgi:nucleoside-diphosphate-sugar epimerase
MPKALVTGASSFVGKRLTRTLKEHGYDIAATARTMDAPLRESLEDMGADISLGDLRNPNTLDRLRQPFDVIIHVAARSSALGVDFTALLEDNIVATQTLATFATSVSCNHLIGLSTVSVHGDVAGPTLSVETGFVNPSAYGITKRVGELVLAEASRHMRVSLVRLPSIIGLGAHRHWLAGMVDRCLRGEKIEIAGPMNMFNNTVHIQDLCNFLAEIAGKAGPAGAAFPIASTHPLAISEIARLIVDETGNRSEIVEKLDAPSSFVIDDSFARGTFGYESMSTTSAICQYVRAEITAAR